MKSIVVSFFIVIAAISILAFFAVTSMNDSHITINGTEIHEVTGMSIAFAGCVIGLLAALFALGLAGLVLVGVSFGLAIVVAVIVGAVALALTPLLVPLLLLVGLALVIKKGHTS